MYEVRQWSEREGKVVRQLLTLEQLDAHMLKLRAAEASGQLERGFCAKVVIVERSDACGDGWNGRTGY